MHILVHILLSCLFIVLRINQSDYVRHARNGTVGEVAQNRSEFAPFPLFYVIKITSIFTRIHLANGLYHSFHMFNHSLLYIRPDSKT